MYLDIARRLSQESHAIRLKVGAVFVSAEGVMSTGINGMPSGGTNECEYREYYDAIKNDSLDEYPYIDKDGFRYKLVTKPELSHAEESVFCKMLSQGVSSKNGYMFITHSPCVNCSKLIFNAGIKYVYYIEDYRSHDGVDYLRKNGVLVEKQDFI